MAEHEPLLTDPPTQETAVHVRDYARFTKAVKWSTITCAIVALLVIWIIT